MTDTSPATGNPWRVEMRDGDRWVPVGVPCPTRADAEHQLYLRGGTGLTYRITHVQPESRESQVNR
jgi:hypothetical protein